MENTYERWTELIPLLNRNTTLRHDNVAPSTPQAHADT